MGWKWRLVLSSWTWGNIVSRRNVHFISVVFEAPGDEGKSLWSWLNVESTLTLCACYSDLNKHTVLPQKNLNHSAGVVQTEPHRRVGMWNLTSAFTVQSLNTHIHTHTNTQTTSDVCVWFYRKHHFLFVPTCKHGGSITPEQEGSVRRFGSALFFCLLRFIIKWTGSSPHWSCFKHIMM